MAGYRGSSRGHPARAYPRRQTAWEVGTGKVAVTTISTSTTGFLGSAIEPTTDGITVIRQRGEFNAWLSAAASALDGFSGAWGIGYASSAAILAGIGSVPTPIAEQASDQWLYHQYFSIKSAGVIDGTVSNDTDGINATSAALRTVVDCKAMRRLPVDFGLYAAFEMTETGAATMHMHWNSRALIKIP